MGASEQPGLGEAVAWTLQQAARRFRLAIRHGPAHRIRALCTQGRVEAQRTLPSRLTTPA